MKTKFSKKKYGAFRKYLNIEKVIDLYNDYYNNKK